VPVRERRCLEASSLVTPVLSIALVSTINLVLGLLTGMARCHPGATTFRIAVGVDSDTLDPPR